MMETSSDVICLWVRQNNDRHVDPKDLSDETEEGRIAYPRNAQISRHPFHRIDVWLTL